MAQSQPVVPPQPNQAFYPVSALYLFQEYRSIEVYQAAFSVAPPQFDFSRRPKLWFDSTVDAANDPLGIVVYNAYRLNPQTQSWSYALIAMPNKEAATVNIPLMAERNAPLMPDWEVPARALLDNEQLFPTIGNALQIKRTDLALQQAQDLGQFTDADRTLLQAIAKQLNVNV